MVTRHNCGDPSRVVRDPHRADLGAAGRFPLAIQWAGRGGNCMCNCADPLKTGVPVTV